MRFKKVSFKNDICFHPSLRLGVYSQRPSSQINNHSVYQHSKSGTRPYLLYKFYVVLFYLSIVWHKVISNSDYVYFSQSLVHSFTRFLDRQVQEDFKKRIISKVSYYVRLLSLLSKCPIIFVF